MRSLRVSAPLVAAVGKRRTTKTERVQVGEASMMDGLSDWERKFVRSIAHQNRLSPRQQEILDKLVEKFLEGKAS
jgi:hypothetical protein